MSAPLGSEGLCRARVGWHGLCLPMGWGISRRPARGCRRS